MSIYLKKAREKKAYTQEYVAKQADISIRAYQNYESGERVPGADVMSKILKVLGYKSTAKTIDHLLEQED